MDMATRLRAKLAGGDADAGKFFQLYLLEPYQRVAIDRCGQDMEIDVGRGEIGAGTAEGSDMRRG